MKFSRQNVNRRNSSTSAIRRFEELEDRRLLAVGNNIAVGDQMRNYRLAVAATAEFTNNLGGQAQALASIQDIVAGLNAVYENEAAIHFDLVAATTNYSLIFTNTATDGYSNTTTPGSTNLSTLRNQNQTKLDSVVGTANYDIGMVLGYETGGGTRGQASLSSVTNAFTKAKSATVGGNPNSSGFLGVIIHEAGHQFNMNHTFNGAAGNCSAGNYGVGVEPGSGSTIMSYSGSCGSDNLAPDGPAEVFHSVSFEEASTYIQNFAAPNSTISTGNAIPTVTGGADFTIPIQTPFELTAIGSDADSAQSLTYSWEQIDVASARQSLPVSDVGNNPLFRQFGPKPEPTRVFPRLSDLLANNNTAANGEALPTTTRDLNFRVTVRDGNGGVNSDDVLVQTQATMGPFVVTSPNTAVNWIGGATQNVTWSVAGTTSVAANVDIYFSSDGGQTFPTLLASNVPNDGSHPVTVPNFDTTSARIKVKGAGNVFFDVSNTNFTIASNSGAPGVNVLQTDGDTRVGEGAIGDSYIVSLGTAPAGDVEITVSVDSESLVSVNGLGFADSQTFTLSSMTPQTIFVKAIDDSIDEGPQTSTISHTVTSSTSSSYPIGFLINPLTVKVVDDELPPVIGVDVDFSGTRPSDWNQIEFLYEDTTNVPKDDGTATPVDLTMSGFGSFGVTTAGPAASFYPIHGQSLTGLGGYGTTTNAITGVWSSLMPGAQYGVFVFGYESDTSKIYSQTVGITGTSALPTFTQNLADGTLFVNDDVGTNSRTLQSYEHVVEADAGGNITIAISPNAGSAGVSIAGLAIRQILTAPLVGDYNGDGFVAQQDLDLVLLNWGDQNTVPTGWNNDLPDTRIDQNELDRVLLNWGNGAPPSALFAANPADDESLQDVAQRHLENIRREDRWRAKNFNRANLLADGNLEQHRSKSMLGKSDFGRDVYVP